MIRTTSRVLTLVLVAVAILATAPAAAEAGKTYGKALTGSEVTKISEILANPAGFVGKTVRVEGVVTAVCERRGCWMSLASDKEFQELRIKVEDGVIVFPLEAKGHKAVAEGVLDKIEMDLDQTVAYLKHQAEEQGEKFDPASVKEPMSVYQVRALGAVIY